jgi:hypothetical protein
VGRNFKATSRLTSSSGERFRIKDISSRLDEDAYAA